MTWSLWCSESQSVTSLPRQAPTRWRGAPRCIAAVTLGLLGAPGVAAAQSPAKMYRVGWLGDGSPPAGPSPSGGDFQQALREDGYVEDAATWRSSIDTRRARSTATRPCSRAGTSARGHHRNLGERAAFAARAATKTIPIVVTQIAMDPVKSGLVASLGRPEGNVTGLATLSENLWQKRLGLLKEIAPKVDARGAAVEPGESRQHQLRRRD